MPRVLAPGRAVIAAALAVSCAVLIRPAAAQHGGPSPEPEPPPQEQAGPPAPPPLRPVSFEDLPGWPSDSHAEILPVLQASCAALRPMRPEAPLGGAGEAALRAGTAAAWANVCSELRLLERALPRPPRQGQGRAYERRVAVWLAAKNLAVRDFIEARFEAFSTGPGIMTGYYEPILRGALEPDEVFRTPLLARPPELVEAPVNGNPLRRRYGVLRDGRMEPFFDRAAIDGGALSGRGLELVWVDDPTDAFFLHIQGSGRVILPNGEMLRVGYAGQNGRSYVSIGRVLIDRGDIARDQMSMQSLRAWLGMAGYDRAIEVFRANPSYIFFRFVDGLTPDQGPIGAMGVPLTPQRSVAVDRSFIPLGLPMWVQVRDPGARRDTPPEGRLVIAQDTGGAIRGPARTDFFWGWGQEAGERAGRMREENEVFLLLPRTAPVSTAEAQ